jgi:hypothetical protein
VVAASATTPQRRGATEAHGTRRRHAPPVRVAIVDELGGRRWWRDSTAPSGEDGKIPPRRDAAQQVRSGDIIAVIAADAVQRNVAV